MCLKGTAYKHFFFFLAICTCNLINLQYGEIRIDHHLGHEALT